MTDARLKANARMGIPPLCGKCGGRTDGLVSAPSMRGFGALISCECPADPADAAEPTNVTPIRPDMPTVVTDSAALNSIEVAARAEIDKDRRQRELLRLALVRGRMALTATTRAMFLHHAAAAERHIRDMGVR